MPLAAPACRMPPSIPDSPPSGPPRFAAREPTQVLAAALRLCREAAQPDEAAGRNAAEKSPPLSPRKPLISRVASPQAAAKAPGGVAREWQGALVSTKLRLRNGRDAS